jgi:hypothetical protein
LREAGTSHLCKRSFERGCILPQQSSI